MRKDLLGKTLVMGVIVLFIGAVVVPSISGNNITKSENIIKPQLIRDVLFSDDFNDNSKDYSKWSEAYFEGTWYERNGQTEFHCYEGVPGYNHEAIESVGIPVILDGDPLVVECIMDTFVDNYPDPYYQWVGQTRVMLRDSVTDNKIIVVYYRASNEIFIMDTMGTRMTIGFSDEFRFKVTITLHLDKYMVDVGPYTSGWISESNFPSEFTMILSLWVKCAGDYPSFWWIAGFDDVVVSKGNGGSNPDKPNRPSGPISGKPGEEYIYTTYYTDPEGDQVYYKWDWADGTVSDWIGSFDSGDPASATHSWSNNGMYSIRVKARDINNDESDWSDPLVVSMPRDKATNNVLLLRLLEQFPLLQKLLFSL